MIDLPVEAFIVLRNELFKKNGEPKQFHLRDKKGTQDDPFDEYIHELLQKNIKNIECTKAPGPLITPDLVIWRPDLVKKASKNGLKDDAALIVGIEVKKIERTKGGKVARHSGLDYNTTPPCGTIRIFDEKDNPIDIRGYYLFTCLERGDSEQKNKVTAMCLCDGNVLNEDFELYLYAVGRREKEIGLGSYKDGANRNRPMFIFVNPLGANEIDRSVTLIHPDPNLEAKYPGLKIVYKLTRTGKNGSKRTFHCARYKDDVPPDWEIKDLNDPFPVPERVKETQSRGKFRLPFRVRDG